MTIKEIEKLVDATLESKGFKRDFPILINKRFCKTYGAVRRSGKNITSMEFSAKYLKVAPEEEIRTTVLHECAHAIVDLRYPNEFHQHDNVFRSVCAEIGVRGDTYSNYIMKGKYNVYCPNCGLLGSYERRCKTVEAILLGDIFCRLCGATVKIT